MTWCHYRSSKCQHYPAYPSSAVGGEFAQTLSDSRRGLRRASPPFYCQWSFESRCGAYWTVNCNNLVIRFESHQSINQSINQRVLWCSCYNCQSINQPLYCCFIVVTGAVWCQRAHYTAWNSQQRVSEELTERASQFGLILDDIAIVRNVFALSYSGALGSVMKKLTRLGSFRCRHIWLSAGTLPWQSKWNKLPNKKRNGPGFLSKRYSFLSTNDEKNIAKKIWNDEFYIPEKNPDEQKTL